MAIAQRGCCLALAAATILLRAQHSRLHGIGLDHHVGDRAHDFLLVRICLHVFLRGRAGDEQAQLLGIVPPACVLPPACLPVLRPTLGPAITSSISFLMAGISGKLSAHGALQQPAGDDQPVDFVGAFEDAVDARVAIGALGRILLDEAVAAVDLHGLVDHVVDHLRAPDLDDGALDRVLLDRLASFLGGIGLACRLRRARRPSCRRCDRPAPRRRRCNVAMLASFSRTRPKSAMTLPNALRCLAYAIAFSSDSARAAHAHRAQLEAANVEDVEGDDVPLADFAEHVLDRHLAVVEDQRAGGRSADAHLVLFRADGEAGESLSRPETR